MALRDDSPSALLRLVPVLSSTAAATFCAAEYWAILPQLRADFPAQGIRAWWQGNLVGGIALAVGSGLTSVTAGALVWRRLSSPMVARPLYGWGALAAGAHFLFVPWIQATIARMVEEGRADEKQQTRRWLGLHTLRTLTCDLPALVCFVVGFLHTI